jgi:MFS transporter, putative metabolite:H+ symporter
MFKDIEQKQVSKGNFFMFFTNRKRFTKYLLSILIGLPTWYVIGILVGFSDQFGKHFNISEPVEPGRGIMYAYAAISIGDILIGLVSQLLKSRKKALFIFYGITAIGIYLFFTQNNGSAGSMYMICALLGFGTGFWAIFVTMAAEQFGTNLRATAATTVPNMVRGALPIMGCFFKSMQPAYGYVTSAIIIGVVVMVISSLAAAGSEETFGKDLDFLEH